MKFGEVCRVRALFPVERVKDAVQVADSVKTSAWSVSEGGNHANTQDRRMLLSEARASPPLILGVMINSSTVTFESST